MCPRLRFPVWVLFRQDGFLPMQLESCVINRLQLFLHFSVWALDPPRKIVIFPLWPRWKRKWNVVYLTAEIVLGRLERGLMGGNAFRGKAHLWESYLTSDCCLTLHLYLWILTKRPLSFSQNRLFQSEGVASSNIGGNWLQTVSVWVRLFVMSIKMCDLNKDENLAKLSGQVTSIQ